ncbi:MAG: hypothetical protein HWD61_14505 [Parachlamydiaceae bacterium]|nr:MAG: hypothetical protein HWD61_14505 [Parachlamydiaceae bacterium]
METLVLAQKEQQYQKELAAKTLENRENYPELLATLEMELAQNRGKQAEFEEIIFQLKRKNNLEKRKREESENQLAQLMTALELQTLAIAYKQEPIQNIQSPAISFEQQEYQQLKKKTLLICIRLLN